MQNKHFQFQQLLTNQHAALLIALVDMSYEGMTNDTSSQ